MANYTIHFNLLCNISLSFAKIKQNSNTLSCSFEKTIPQIRLNQNSACAKGGLITESFSSLSWASSLYVNSAQDSYLALFFGDLSQSEKFWWSKGQIISKANFEVFIWTKNWTKIFLYFCPRFLKWVNSKKEYKLLY